MKFLSSGKNIFPICLKMSLKSPKSSPVKKMTHKKPALSIEENEIDNHCYSVLESCIKVPTIDDNCYKVSEDVLNNSGSPQPKSDSCSLQSSCEKKVSEKNVEQPLPKKEIVSLSDDVKKKNLPKKRSHSFCEDEIEKNTSAKHKYTTDSPSPVGGRSSPFHSPSPYRTCTPGNTSRSRKSLPSRFSPFSTPPPSVRSCEADQTPYAEDTVNYQPRKRLRTNVPRYCAKDLQTLESESGFIDTHCHLDFLFHRQNYVGSFSKYQQEHQETFPNCFKGCLAVFCNPRTFGWHQRKQWETVLKEENVWATFGCHPHNAKDYDDLVEKNLCACLDNPKVRAIGEIGLDYSNRNNCEKEQQFEAFRRQLKIGLQRKLPVVLHCREAFDDAMAIIKEILPSNYRIHLHCFTSTWDIAQVWLEEFPNLCIGLTNLVTFPGAHEVHEVASNLPLDRLLLETDAPYFMPKALKGMRHSHPGMAIHVAAQIAALRGIPIGEVLDNARRNTKRMYNI